MLPGKAAPKGATIESQLKRIEVVARKQNIAEFNIDPTIRKLPAAGDLNKADLISSRLVIFNKNVQEDRFLQDVKEAGEYIDFTIVDALESVIGLISAGTLDKRSDFVVTIRLVGGGNGLSQGLRVWHNPNGVLGLRKIEMPANYVHSSGLGTLIAHKLSE